MRYFNTILLFTLLVFSTSCKNKDNKVEKKEVTIAMVTFPGYAPLYVAEEKGLFKNLDVNLIRIEDIGQMRSAMSSGQVDVYASTYDIFQSTQGADVPGIGFMLIDESHGADGILVNESISTIADLKGKRLAAEPGLPPYFLLQYVLDKEGMTLDDVMHKDIATQDAGAAFTSGSVDAVGLYEPVLSLTKQANEGSRILISSETEPGLLADLLFASEKLTNNNPEVLKSIAEGWFAALDYIDKNPEEAYEIMGKSFGVSADEMIEIKSGITWYNKEDNIKLFNKSTENNVYDIFKMEGDILEKNGAAKVRFKPEDKITSEIINSIK